MNCNFCHIGISHTVSSDDDTATICEVCARDIVAIFEAKRVAYADKQGEAFADGEPGEVVKVPTFTKHANEADILDRG